MSPHILSVDIDNAVDSFAQLKVVQKIKIKTKQKNTTKQKKGGEQKLSRKLTLAEFVNQPKLPF